MCHGMHAFGMLYISVIYEAIDHVAVYLVKVQQKKLHYDNIHCVPEAGIVIEYRNL